jgi:hypothetical protein
VQYELDHDEQGLRARLAALGTAVGVLAAH